MTRVLIPIAMMVFFAWRQYRFSKRLYDKQPKLTPERIAQARENLRNHSSFRIVVTVFCQCALFAIAAYFLFEALTGALNLSIRGYFYTILSCGLGVFIPIASLLNIWRVRTGRLA